MNLSGEWYQLHDGTFIWSEPPLWPICKTRRRYAGMAWYAIRPDRRWRDGPRKTDEGILDQLSYDDRRQRRVT